MKFDPRFGVFPVTAVDDEAETGGLRFCSKLQEIQLIAIGRQHGVFRRVQWIVVAESAWHTTDREHDVIAAVEQAEPRMPRGQCFCN